MASQNNELLEEIRKLTREKQLLELQIERENITNARKVSNIIRIISEKC
jgi:hypothetical protein